MITSPRYIMMLQSSPCHRHSTPPCTSPRRRTRFRDNQPWQIITLSRNFCQIYRTFYLECWSNSDRLSCDIGTVCRAYIMYMQLRVLLRISMRIALVAQVTIDSLTNCIAFTDYVTSVPILRHQNLSGIFTKRDKMSRSMSRCTVNVSVWNI